MGRMEVKMARTTEMRKKGTQLMKTKKEKSPEKDLLGKVGLSRRLLVLSSRARCCVRPLTYFPS